MNQDRVLLCMINTLRLLEIMSRVSCQKGPTHHAYAWQIGPSWQDTLDVCVNEWTKGQMDERIFASEVVNSLWSNDAMWQQRYQPALIQVIACCLMAQSH